MSLTFQHMEHGQCYEKVIKHCCALGQAGYNGIGVEQIPDKTEKHMNNLEVQGKY